MRAFRCCIGLVGSSLSGATICSDLCEDERCRRMPRFDQPIEPMALGNMRELVVQCCAAR
jgi:hypothetical protein